MREEEKRARGKEKRQRSRDWKIIRMKYSREVDVYEWRWEIDRKLANTRRWYSATKLRKRRKVEKRTDRELRGRKQRSEMKKSESNMDKASKQ